MLSDKSWVDIVVLLLFVVVVDSVVVLIVVVVVVAFAIGWDRRVRDILVR